jgi:MFS family permease
MFFAVATMCYGISAPAIGALEARWGRLRAAVAGLIAISLALPAVAAANSLALAFVAAAAAGVAVGLTITPTMPALAEIVDRLGGGSYGAAYGIFNIAWAVGTMIGPMLGSVLAEQFGFSTSVYAIAAAVLLAAVMLRKAGSRPGSALEPAAQQSS